MFWKETSDAEVIERARRGLRQLERWGRWLTAWYVTIAIAMGLAIAWGGQLLFNLMVGAQNRLELAIGIIIGVFFGTMLHQVFHNLVIARLARVPDGRDRLLVQYHDALVECVRNRSNEDDASDLEPPNALARFEAGASCDPAVPQ